MAKRQSDPEIVQQIIADLRAGNRDDVIILFVPSHDKSRPQRELKDQDVWANNAVRLFSDLYGGATAIHAFAGGWIDDDGTFLSDQPIMVQSLADRPQVEDEARLRSLLSFAKRMGRDTNQAAVMIIFNDVRHYITDFRP